MSETVPTTTVPTTTVPTNVTAAELTVRDVARVLEVTEARLRYWAQTGLVGASVRRGGRFFYTFQDLVAVKVVKDLVDGGLTVQRVRTQLAALVAALPHVDRPLASLRICSDGERLVVVGDDAVFEPASGQLVMSFAVAALGRRAAEVAELPAPTPSPPPAPAANSNRITAESAYRSFVDAVAAEERGDLRGAETLLRRAVEMDPHLGAAWTNLGSLLARRGSQGDARDAWERALARDPDQPEARYNLANLMADLGETELAVAMYRRVVVATPQFADAHYNLGMLLLRSGAVADAAPHLRQYLELDPTSDWARQATAELAAQTATVDAQACARTASQLV